jgi:hypothetical protein
MLIASSQGVVMAETEILRCIACGLEIATQEGHYHLVDRHYHPECYDRKIAATPRRTIWPKPPPSAAQRGASSARPQPQHKKPRRELCAKCRLGISAGEGRMRGANRRSYHLDCYASRPPAGPRKR